MEMNRRQRLAEWLLTLPSLLWLSLFFLLPTAIIFLYAFRPADPLGGAAEGWSTEAIQALGQPHYLVIFGRTLWLSILTTIISLILSLPVAYFLARLSSGWRFFVLLLVILPFWSNFLIRIFAWRALLHPEGPVQQLFVWLGLIEPNSLLLYNNGAVLLVLVYTSLPFSILALYAAAERFDFSLLEAARDLGSSAFHSFYRIFLPGISKGLFGAMLLVLIPALGSFAIPDLVGGINSEMIGNRIAQRAIGDRNIPEAAALAAALALAVFIPLLFLARSRRTREAA